MQLQVEICPSKTFGFFWLCVDRKLLIFVDHVNIVEHIKPYVTEGGQTDGSFDNIYMWSSGLPTMAGACTHKYAAYYMRTYLVFGVAATTFDIVLDVGYTFAALIPTVVRQWDWGMYHLPIHSHPIACVTGGAFCDLSAWNETCCLSV